MPVIIKKVQSKKELKKFVEFPNSLYKGNLYYVPALFADEMMTFDRKKNAAFEFCEADCFLAYKDGKLAGRVAAIINKKANESWNKKEVRYGWIDFIDDREVSKALIESVIDWGLERGMEVIAGPLGFTDFDPEGLLVEGFDKLATMACRYHYPYYMEHLEALGLTKEVDWLEHRLTVPDVLPERLERVARIVSEKYKLRFMEVTRKEVLKGGLGYKFFELINQTYCVLYGYSLLSEGQIDQYVKTYLQIIDLKMVSFIENEEGEIIAAGVTMPSMSKVLQKCQGKLFPLGWWYFLKNMFIKKDDTLDMLLIGVKPEYQNKGVNSLLFADLFPRFRDMGFKWAETNANLETNTKVQALWDDFEFEQHKRRRIYAKHIK